MAAINKLSATQVRSISKPGMYGDGAGLWLQVSPGNRKGGSTAPTKSWLFRYMIAGRARSMGLGRVSLVANDGGVSLSEARELRHRYHAMIREGRDPIDERKASREATRAEAAKMLKFSEAAEQYIKAHKAGWKNAKHGDQWENTLRDYAYPVIGSLSVASIETPHVLKILEPIWTKKTETASRVRGRIERILDWAKVQRYRDGENPARWKGHLENLLPKRSAVRPVRHHPAMPYRDVPAFMQKLNANGSLSAKALALTIHTALRTGEVVGARWPEIDLKAKVWTVPADRMKMKREHRAPLSDAAVAILESLPREAGTDYVFPGARRGRPISTAAMSKALKTIDGDAYTVHGFRSSFRDWAAETTNYQNHVVEMALAHVVGDKVEKAYRRGALLEQRARLMRDWSRYCVTLKAAKQGDNVVTIGEARA